MSDNMSAGISGPSTPRVDWVDYAKGICIILVVMMHSTLGVEKAAGELSWLNGFIEWARPFRMPDFFLISGLFLSIINAILVSNGAAHLALVSFIVTAVGVIGPVLLYWSVRNTPWSFLFRRPQGLRLSATPRKLVSSQPRRLEA